MEIATDPEYRSDLVDVIGADPKPWALNDNPQLRASEAEAYKTGWDYTWAPRPEYDTANNPILNAFCHSGLTATEFLTKQTIAGATNKQFTHATRVLRKLAEYEAVDTDGWGTKPGTTD